MRQELFLDVLPGDEARRQWEAALDLAPLPAEDVPLAEALGRVLAEDVRALGDVPPFDRSDVDGFAVRAEDTFGAGERDPARLRLAGSPIDAGTVPGGEVEAGEARPIATGGVLPRGADAVVMVEDTEPSGGGHVLVTRPA
ncbi:MAG: molybdopterin biosynthesis protein, partial [Planctomycetota bacterium]